MYRPIVFNLRKNWPISSKSAWFYPKITSDKYEEYFWWWLKLLSLFWLIFCEIRSSLTSLQLHFWISYLGIIMDPSSQGWCLDQPMQNAQTDPGVSLCAKPHYPQGLVHNEDHIQGYTHAISLAWVWWGSSPCFGCSVNVSCSTFWALL